MSGQEEARYADYTDEEVEQLILERLREIKELLREIKEIFERVE